MSLFTGARRLEEDETEKKMDARDMEVVFVVDFEDGVGILKVTEEANK